MHKKQKAFFVESGKKQIQLKEIDVPKPKANELLIQHVALGINFLDYEYYRGSVKLPKSPIIPGIEGIGIVKKMGSKVNKYFLKQKVGYATALGGGYSEYRTIDQNLVFAVPLELTVESMVMNLTKAMTAHYLMRRTFFLREKMTVLIHGVSSGVGQIMTRLAKQYKANVIGTVGSDAKISEIKGCKAVLNYNEDFAKEVNEITENKGVNVVYDLIGGDLLLRSYKCIIPFGLLASVGQARNKPKIVSPKLLSKKSLFFTAPKLQVYKQDYEELSQSALEVFHFIQKKIIPTTPNHIYKFDEIPQIMKDFEEEKYKGLSIIKFD